MGDFHASRARLRIPSAPARTSKSFASAYDALPEVFPEWEIDGEKVFPKQVRVNDDRRIWLVGPDYDTNKEFDYIFRELVERQKIHGLDYKIETAQYAPKQGNMKIQLDFGKDRHGQTVRTVIEGKSSTNERSLQAEEIDYCVLSEAAEHDAKIWNRYLATRCRKAVFPTTPKIKAEWLKELINLGESNPEVGIEVFQFTPRCNPDYDWQRFWQEHQKAESRVIGKIEVRPKVGDGECAEDNGHNCFDPMIQCRAMRDPWFAEQFGGQWSYEADRVLPFRWNSDYGQSHVLDVPPVWLGAAKKYVGVDYGYTDPAVALWMAVGPDGTMVLYREIYERGLDPEDFVRRIKAQTSDQERIEFFVGDPQQPQLESFFRKLGLPVWSRYKKAMRDRASGGMRLVDALSHDPAVGHPRLFVLSPNAGAGLGCPKTIQEWKLLRRKPGLASAEWSAAAIVGDDHAFDAVRYLLSAQPTAPYEAQVADMNDVFDRHIRQVRAHRRRLGSYAQAGV